MTLIVQLIDITDEKRKQMDQRAFVVAQLEERTLPIPEVHCSSLVISKIL